MVKSLLLFRSKVLHVVDTGDMVKSIHLGSVDEFALHSYRVRTYLLD
jgi:hypothetical protein